MTNDHPEPEAGEDDRDDVRHELEDDIADDVDLGDGSEEGEPLGSDDPVGHGHSVAPPG